MTTRAAAEALIAGSLLFGFGASIGVPGVFMISEAEKRLELIERRMTWWRLGQPLYVLGPLVAAMGIGVLAIDADDGAATALLGLAAATMLASVGAWGVDCYLRGAHPADFAYGRLPGWPFVIYVLGTVAGLALVAAGFAADDHSAWLWGVILAADIFFLMFYLVTRDIPPFFFYLLTLAVGVVLTIAPGI